MNRSIQQKCSVKKGFLKNLAKFTGKHLCQSLFINNVADWCFPVNFAKFLRTSLDDCFHKKVNNFKRLYFSFSYSYELYLKVPIASFSAKITIITISVCMYPFLTGYIYCSKSIVNFHSGLKV